MNTDVTEDGVSGCRGRDGGRDGDGGGHRDNGPVPMAEVGGFDTGKLPEGLDIGVVHVTDDDDDP